MKNHIAAVCSSTIVLFLLLAADSFAQRAIPLVEVSPLASVSQRLGVTDITITYHRPAVNGRAVWGSLVPYDVVWRAGANENTTISFTDPVTIGGKELPAGEYGIHMIPSKDEFTVIINGFSKGWGSFSYKQEEDVVRFKVKPVSAEHMEWLNYNFETSERNKTKVVLHWEKLKIPFNVEVDVNTVVVNQFKDNLRGLNQFFWQPWQQAANFCINNNTHLDDAAVWADRAVQMNRSFATLSTKSRLLALTGKTNESQNLMNEALGVANEAEINNYGYTLLQAQKIDDAIGIFKMNVDRYPNSWNVYDSLAEGYLNKGDKKMAKEFYSKAYEMVQDETQKKRIDDTLKGLAAN